MTRTGMRRRDVLAGGVATLAGCALPRRRDPVRPPSSTPGTPDDAMPRARDRPGDLRAQRLAWAGVRLDTGTASLWLDPLADAEVWGPALKDPLVPPTPERDRQRYVVVTHRHPDHFDPIAVRAALGDAGTLVCAQETATIAAGRGFKLRVASLYEPILLGDDFTATAVPAVDGYGDPQVSWVIAGGGRRIIHCGDTLWHGAWWHIGRNLGPFDAAFLPINGAKFAWRKPVSDIPAVLTPEQAIAAAVIVGARLVVPIHYGVVGAEGYEEIPDAAQRLVAEGHRRHVAVELVRPGDWVDWR